MKLPALLLAAALLCPFARAADAPAKPAAPAKTEAKAEAPHAPDKVQSLFQRLINAIELNDHEAFVADAADVFKAAATPQVVSEINKGFAPRLKDGELAATYFGQLKQDGYDVYVWKLSFADKGNDLLATLSMKDDKVYGFFAR